MKGKWIPHEDWHPNIRYGCNICGNLTNERTRYCPICGNEKYLTKEEIKNWAPLKKKEGD